MARLEGRTLAGRYRVDEYIGGGGMGDVYKVWDSPRSCYLAAKVVRRGLAEIEELARRFEREAEALTRLQHPNIVRLYGLERDEEEDLAFIVMDYVDGPTLADKLKLARGPLPLSEVVSIAEGVAAALTYAHKQGIYHRDIKPSNILIARDGRAILSDFGIARLSDALTTTYQGIGTPAYMSPEQCQDQEIGAPSDIYSLGVVLYECLTGRRPFLGDLGRGEPPTIANIIREHVELPPPPPADINPSIRPQVEAVIMKALAKDPQYRYQSAAELARALRVAAGGSPLPSLRVTTTPGGAQVYVDAVLRGASPLEIPQLSEGSHQVRIVAQGYQDYQETIQIPEFRTLDVRLEPAGIAETIRQVPTPAAPAGAGGIAPPAKRVGLVGRWWRKWWFRVAVGLGFGGIAIGAVAILFVLGQGGGSEEASIVAGSRTPQATATRTAEPTPSPIRSATPTAMPASTPRPTAAPTPIATAASAPAPGTVLYQADWSSGLAGWPANFGWKWVEGMLVNDGSNHDERKWIAAPYKPGDSTINDYAVEAEMQLVRGREYGCPSFGIVVRQAYQVGACVPWAYIRNSPSTAMVRVIGQDPLEKTDLRLDTDWHAYRIEVRGNSIQLLIDGAVVLETIDNQYLTGGQVGLLSNSVQVNVRSFKVIAL